MEVPQKGTKPTHAPHAKKRGRPSGARDLISRRHLQKQRAKQNKSPDKTVEEPQHDVEKIPEVIRPEDGNPSENLCAQSNAGRSEHRDSIVVENHAELEEINEEIFTNYVYSRESYKRMTTMSTYTLPLKLLRLLNWIQNLSPWQCQKRLDWVKWKEAIEAKLHSLNKKKYSVLLPEHLLKCSL